MRTALLCFSIFWVVACSKEDDRIEPVFREYTDRFEQEATNRGLDINLDERSIAVVSEVDENSIRIGFCEFDFDNVHTVYINRVFWDVLDDLGKEKLIFHELGHCVLNRPHLETQKQNGRCRSIMHSGQSCSDDYSEDTRAEYLDELFFR